MKALVLDQIDNRTVAAIKAIDLPALAEGDVRVAIDWSSLNYKDALAITGKGKIIRQFPMVPGIDFAGRVSESRDPRFAPGQDVILTGWGVGENHWGGLATEACVKGDWLVAQPAALSARQAMIIGTAGFTAMLCVDALVNAGVTPESGDILVTGASGGVGSTAVVLLKALGYRVTAVSGRESTHDYLRQLGADAILPRSDFAETRPLEKQLSASGPASAGELLPAGGHRNYAGAGASVCRRFPQQHDSRPDAGQYRPVILFSRRPWGAGLREDQGISFPSPRDYDDANRCLCEW